MYGFSTLFAAKFVWNARFRRSGTIHHTNRDSACFLRYQPDDRSNERGLAGTVRTEEAVDLALPNTKRYAVEGAKAAERLEDAVDLNGKCLAHLVSFSFGSGSMALSQLSASSVIACSPSNSTLSTRWNMGRVIRWKKIGPMND